MKLLVTGGTGFLGKALALRLATLGHTVSVLGRNRLIGAALEEKGIRFLAADLSDEAAVREACRAQAAVFHCGALSAPWGPSSAFYQANVTGTQNIIAGCREHQTTLLIHVSTPSIYFDYQSRYNIREHETLPRQACNYYAYTKRLAEERVDQASREGLHTLTLRPRGIFGPGDTSLIPRLLRANQRGGIPLIEDGNAIVDITYVDNVVDALIACLSTSEEAYGRKFNITNGEPMALKDILDQLFQRMETPLKYRPMRYRTASSLAGLMELASHCLTLGRIEPPLTRYTVGVLSKSQTLDISAAREWLGYQPKVSVQEGLHRFSEWWKKEAV